ncbi:TonB-dependent copper receptor [Mesoterricola silvestris]|uniref:Copper transporter porin n=1 Tax=Mesoterricola silvestris TaxID=2927979 RepID=A0AA48K846_9BACT|nr:TonB-dependent copper receptor [Mesoterricola silvestris]BDU71856.1 copper transporter porin [Mesoterricola silvestris]
MGVGRVGGFWMVAASLPVMAGGAPEGPKEGKVRETPSAVVEVTAPLPSEPLVTVLDPRGARQPVPAQDGADGLRTVPGFSVVRKGGSDGDPVLRGMAGSRLLLLLDGEQILGGCGGRMDPPTAYVFPESFDRITVVKGPQTVLHGPGNSAGTVLFERTRERLAGPSVKGYASAMGGSFGRDDEVLDVTGGNRDIVVRGTGTRSHAGDFRDGGGASVHSFHTRWSANLALGWTPGDDTRLEVTTARSDGEAAYADRGVDGTRFRRENAGFRAEFRRVASWLEKVEFQVFRNYVDHIMDNYSLRTFTPTVMAPEPSAMNPDRTTTGGRLAGELRLGASTLATLGLDAQRNEHTGRMSMMQWSMPEEGMPRVADARFRNAGLFGEARHAFTGADRVVGGLRVDRWRAEDPRPRVSTGMMGSSPNPTAGARRKETLGGGFLRYERGLPEEATWYAGIGRAERFPDYWEAIAKESLASVSAFGTRPERTTQVDLGWIRRAGPLQGSLSVFANRVSDYILIQSNVMKPAGMMGTRAATVTRNVDAASYGGEATGMVRFAGGLRLDGSLAYVRGRNRTDGLALAQIPPLEARLGIVYQGDTWSAGLLTRGVARQDRVAVNQGTIVGQDLGPTGGFGVLSLNGAWNAAPGLVVSFGVDNLANRLYAEHVSRGATAVPGYAPQTLRVGEPGRNLWVKLAYAFGACH